MAYSPIDKPNTHFNPVTYSGDSATNHAITGVGFQPNFTWIKPRTEVHQHSLMDSIRGGNKILVSQGTNAEATDPIYGWIDSFDTDGFTTQKGSNTSQWNVNQTGEDYISWNWKGGGTAVSNTDGTITSSVSANTTSGFSIVTYTGNATTSQSVGHGLNSVPKMIIVKNRIDASDWKIYHASLGTGYQIILNSSAAASSAGTLWGSTTPTSNLFYINNDGSVNGSGDGMVAYCFSEIKGYSKFGSYAGNGSTDGTFVYTGFKPAFVMWKRSDSAGYDWDMYDTTRDTYNVAFKELIANSSGVESSSTVLSLDILSNGFKLRTSNANGNASGGTYIYMAFAENPLVASNYVPTTAR